MTTISAEAKALRAKYMREWRKKNPGKDRQYTNAKWERKAAELKEKAAAKEPPGE